MDFCLFFKKNCFSLKGINNHFLFLAIPEETKPVVYSTGGYSLPPFQKVNSLC
nr:MAG TPA: hypothetical protein [Caudoviricetes sp.]